MEPVVEVQEPVVEVRDVWHSYGESAVLRGVSFSIPRGAFTALTGRSGSGKSTLFNLIAGLDQPLRGNIMVDGLPLADRSDEEMSLLRLRRIGLVLQRLNLLPDLTLSQNIRLPMDLAGASRARSEEKASELLSLVGLSAYARRKPNSLSGGEAQRGAIARALANDAPIILADEPTASLDRMNASRVLDAFEEAHRRLGTTILLITHDPMAVERARSRLVIEDGLVHWAQAPEPARRGALH